MKFVHNYQRKRFHGMPMLSVLQRTRIRLLASRLECGLDKGPIDTGRPLEAKVGALKIHPDAYREDARGAYRVDACLGVLESDAILYPRRQKLGRVKEDLRVGLGHGQRAGVDYRVEKSGYAQADEDSPECLPPRRGRWRGPTP